MANRMDDELGCGRLAEDDIWYGEVVTRRVARPGVAWIKAGRY
jgi:hypothetical protein